MCLIVKLLMEKEGDGLFDFDHGVCGILVPVLYPFLLFGGAALVGGQLIGLSEAVIEG